MRFVRSLTMAASLAAIFIAAGATFVHAGAGFTFKVHNNTDNAIKRLLASEDGKTYGQFDIGSGIAAGASASLVWDKSTDDSNCEWYFKAVYDDGSESQPVPIDFCESNLELEFDE